jgi:hypothetical protein
VIGSHTARLGEAAWRLECFKLVPPFLKLEDLLIGCRVQVRSCVTLYSIRHREHNTVLLLMRTYPVLSGHFNSGSTVYGCSIGGQEYG